MVRDPGGTGPPSWSVVTECGDPPAMALQWYRWRRRLALWCSCVTSRQYSPAKATLAVWFFIVMTGVCDI